MSQVGPLELLFLLFLLALWAGCILGCRAIATAKGRDGTLWAILGFVFGLFALLLVALLPRASAATSGQWSDTQPRPLPPPTLPPEGWYPDPEQPGQQHWWDGRRWTGARKDVEPAASPEPPESG